MFQHRLLQFNANHSSMAQDLLRHALLEWRIGLAVLAEPYCVLRLPSWLGSADGSVAIMSSADLGASPLTPLRSSGGLVVAQWGETVMGCIARPIRASTNLKIGSTR